MARKPDFAAAGEYLSLAFLLPVSTFVGYAIGYVLDKVFQTHFLYIPFLLFGIAAGLIQIVRAFTRHTPDDAE